MGDSETDPQALAVACRAQLGEHALEAAEQGRIAADLDFDARASPARKLDLAIHGEGKPA